MEVSSALKCTACQITLDDAEGQRRHYKTDWHRYNLKRKVAGIGPISLQMFERKLALLASVPVTVKGVGHLKQTDRRKGGRGDKDDKTAASSSTAEAPSAAGPAQPSSVEYKLTQCFFDDTEHESIDKLLTYMGQHYSFFIPDAEYLVDIKGLLRFLGGKVFERHQCLYCNKVFSSLSAVRDHMLAKGHTQVGIDNEEILAEIEPFYDYRASYKELYAARRLKSDGKQPPPSTAAVEGPERMRLSDIPEEAAGEEDEWEAVDEEGEIDISDEEDFGAILEQYGLSSAEVTATGNLKLPDGREAAHRSVAYVYRQRIPNRTPPGGPVAAALQDKTNNPRLMLTEGKELTADEKMEKRRLRKETASILKRHLAEQTRLGVKSNRLARNIVRSEQCSSGR
ncbi:unnamed protein product [Vitrella brassicaformis CCMP3155]|uniref:C2H2-type domain-containing protein n=1 Tax=Vitrella brassicaformis (strain CCMP3155) TaxID=1169540 RepID=A0A0G4FF17_VITBC|nr:unnamed protein product [Vitrella brassicaformis CCMP3155]|eukprot:CEM11799.1 unnamed protein product [Vitrella brassicaformis CCMP3155]